MNFWIAFAGLVLIAIWITAGGFVTQASTLFHADKNVNEFSHRAYWYTFWAAFVTWTLVGLALIAGFLSLTGIFSLFSFSTVASTLSPYSKPQGISISTVIFLLVCMALVFTTGVLSALAAYNMQQSNLMNENNERLAKGYSDCVIAAVSALTAGGLLVIAIIAVIVVGIVRKNRETKIIEQKRRVSQQQKKREEGFEKLIEAKIVSDLLK